MHYRLLDYLACPIDHAFPLALEPESLRDSDTIQEGHLRCPQCSRDFPITQGIPRLLPDDLLSDSETAREFQDKRTEMKTRDEQVDIYLKNTGLKWLTRIEVPRTFAALDLSQDDFLLEAGCGIGRMTALVAPKARETVGIDISFGSVRRNWERLPEAVRAKAHLIQADLSHIPLRGGLFTRALSSQVLEHIPTHESRARAIDEIGRALAPGARFVLSAYQHSLLFRLFGQKEGFHPGGLHFYRFTAGEFKELLSRRFHVHSLIGILAYLHFAACVRKG
ncbi:MAG: methyltransferase domain-containing protein [Armatimonadetes bacterium]|nr:methyltransferase domain-containing protein [Armatimonadota bacterium]